jgi:hypothetical protein
MLNRYLNQWGFLPVLLLLFVAVQVPFLEADPHTNISLSSRDAFTDEGLNTSQVINRVNHGHWIVDECDNLIKTPLFSLWLYPVYAIFGTSILAGRLWVLIGCMALLFFASRKNNFLPWVAGVFVLTVLTQYHVFQYVRFTMAEMTACFLVFAALSYAIKYGENDDLWELVWSGIFLWAAVSVKNQFGYVLVFLPVWALIIPLVNRKLWTKRTAVSFVVSITTLALGGAVYYFGWYLQVKETYDYVMADQAGGRFIPLEKFSEMQAQARKFLLSSDVYFLTYLGIFSLVALPINFFTSKNKTLLSISLLSLVWAVAEFHKFGMWYVPSRYLSPFLFAWGIFIAIQLVWVGKNAFDYRFFSRAVSFFALILFLGAFTRNFISLKRTYDGRKFVIHDTNRMLSKIEFGNRPVAGPWAPALARETGARVIPVWFEYFNDDNLIEKFNPKIIVSEADEGDSGGAFKNRGIDLQNRADSIKKVQVGHYEILIYYLP